MSTGSHRLTAANTFRVWLVAGFMMLLAGIAAGPAAAAERPFALEFDRSAIETGLVGDLDLEALSGPSSIEGTIDDEGRVSIPRGKFKLPVLDVSTIAQSLAGIELPVEIEGYMSIEQAATGTFDSRTGELEIQAKAGLWVSINIQQLLGAIRGLGVDLPPELSAVTGLLGQNLTCGFSPMDVTFTTESTSLGQGQRFTRGLSGPGALTAEWSRLGPFAGKTRILGIIDACTTIRTLLPGLLSGIGGGALGGLDLGSLLEGLDELDLGPSSLTISRVGVEPPQPTSRASLKMIVSSKRFGKPVNAGRVYRLTFSNRGRAPSLGTRVCANAPERAVRGSRCVRLGTIAPGQVKRVSFRLSLTRSARRSAYRVTFRMTSSNGKSSVTSVRLSRRAR